MTTDDTWTKRMQRALAFLAETDEQEAKLRSAEELAKEKMKAKFAAIAAHADGTVLQRESVAYGHEEYQSARASYLMAMSEHGSLKNQRSTAAITIEVWRSLNAARNKGQIV